MKHKLITCVLALCLMLNVLPAASAAGGPSLSYTTDGSNAALLSVENLDGRVYGAQLELELDGEYRDVDFVPRDNSAYAPACRTEISGGKTTVYVYLAPDSSAPLGGSGQAALGTLRVDGRLTLPNTATLTLLDRDLRPYDGADHEAVSLRRAGGSSSGGGSSNGSGNSSSAGSDSVRVSGAEHGDVRIRPSRPSRGDTVTITVTPDRGYVLDRLTVVDKDGDRLDLRQVTGKDQDDGTEVYTFTMPRGEVEVRAVFALEEEETPDVPGNIWDPLPFTDVEESAWYWEAVAYAYHNGLMNGTGPQRFSPEAITTRGMIVTILYRLEGSPAASLSRFRDVVEGQYYSSAVAWAAANGVVEGYSDGRFGPDDPITREQMAVILSRYAQYKRYNTGARVSLSTYGDAAQVSPYALEAMQWARAEGLITGTDANLLLPGGNATRVQIAAILMRFCENIAQPQ